MALGPRDTTSLVMLTGWDATALQNYRLQDGTTYAEIVSMVDTALGTLVTEFNSDWMTGLYSVTDQPEVEYRVGVSNGFSDHTEYGRPDEARAATEGHLLPLKAFDRMLGWTWDYLQIARLSQIEADIADAIKDARDKRRVAILTRCLQRGDDSGAAKGLGSSGYSPGFATTAGSTNVDFVPPAFAGVSFASTHEHYVGIAGGVFTEAVFKDVKAELREHGHEPPYEFVAGVSDESVIKGLTGFVPVALANVQYGMTQDRATLAGGSDNVGSYYIGTIEDIAVRIMPGMPQYYGFGYKSYGRLSQRNPLAVRVFKGRSDLSVVAMQDPKAGNGQSPIQNLMTYFQFGVGVKDRTNGTARYVNSASWADGTPT
jgi:hypothetical protein